MYSNHIQVNKFSILIIDDKKNFLKDFTGILGRNDTLVYTAQSSKLAFELMLKHDFAIVLIDIQVSGINGFELAERMRATAQTKNIPIFFITTNSDNQSLLFDGYEDAAVDFLKLPLDSHVVRSKVNLFFEIQKHKTEIKSSELRFRGLLESSPDAIILVNDLGKIEMINKQAELMFGFDQLSVKDKLMSELVPESHCEIFISKMDPILFGKGRSLFGRNKSGNEFSVEISLSLLKLDSICYVSATIRDTSERYAWELEREQLLEKFKSHQLELERSVMLREEFMSIAGHELKTPITALKLIMQMRLKRIANKKKEATFTLENLEEMFKSDIFQINRLTDLIEKILDVTRVNSGKFILKFESFNLGDLVREIIARNREQTKPNDSLISIINYDEIIGYWDRVRIDQVITSLLSNAIKYGEGRPIEITLSLFPEFVQLKVRDHGIGIDKNDQKRIFKRFERAANSDISGFGLGLYIVTQIVNAHKGSISVESELGLGSSFNLTLPLVPIPILLPIESYILGITK